jgi:hypothetical protein
MSDAGTSPVTDRIEWYRVERCAGSDRLVIVFSHIGEKPGRFSFYGTFRDIAVNKLFVNTPANCWYRDGVPGIGDCIESAAEGIRIIMQEIAPRSVMCIGNSMGAYAALLFGALVNADHVLAFGPETLLRLAHSRSRAYIGNRPPTPFDDLLPYLSQPAAGRKTDIVIGESDLVDVHCARRIAHLDGVRIRSLRGVGHEVPATLHHFDAWRPLIGAYVRDGALPPLMPLEGGLLAAGDAAEALLEGRRLRVAGMMKEARARLRHCLDLYPDSDAAHDDTGLIDQHEGGFAKAEAAHRRALRLAPDRAVYHLHLGTALVRQGRFEEGLAAHAQACSLNPLNPELARCMTETKRRLAADRRSAWGEREVFPDQ